MSEPQTFRCPIEVRGYELDSFGHVNHACYFNYLEHARWRMLIEKKMPLTKLQELKRFTVIISVQAHYFKPTFMGDQLEVETHILRGQKTRFEFKQKIFRQKVLVFEATLESVFVDENGKPTSIPQECETLFSVH